MKSVLFLGNSFTFYQDLPGVFHFLTQRAGIDVEVDSVTKGGASLREFLNPKNQIGQKLNDVLKQNWDGVVFQEQSFRPVGNPESFFSAVKELSERFPAAEKFFYQTWAYREGSERLAKKEMTYPEMYEGLKKAYGEAAFRNKGMVVPVGDAFNRIRNEYPEIDLYQSDDYHPSPAGTYLAACMFVAVIFQISPLKLSDALELEPKTAAILRQVAADCVAV